MTHSLEQIEKNSKLFRVAIASLLYEMHTVLLEIMFSLYILLDYLKISFSIKEILFYIFLVIIQSYKYNLIN